MKINNFRGELTDISAKKEPLLQTVPNAPPIPRGVQVLVGNQGQACSAVCEQHGMVCSSPGMASINHCDALREHLACEAGCSLEANRQDAPSYVVYGTAKPLSPTMCFVRSNPDVSCAAAAAHVKRLCACAAKLPVDVSTL